MLSVRRRQEDARGSCVGQPRGMDDDAELEEGEACGDDTAFVDPDVALSYIDKKLQDVLGHFQKDFEGGVSAENLGSKFGGYGSFLPTYQRSPAPQARSPPRASNVTSRSPFHQSVEGTSQNPSTVAAQSLSQNNGSVVPLSGDSNKKEIHMARTMQQWLQSKSQMASPTCHRRRCQQPFPPAMGWAALPHDILATVFLKLGTREVMRSAEFVCKSWRLVAVEEPALWHRVEMPRVRRSSRGWRTMVSAAIDHSAGQCTTFSGPCDSHSLIDLVERAPLLQTLDLFDYIASNDVLTESITRLHLLEDLEISPAHNCSEATQKLFPLVCRACPRLRRLVMGHQILNDDRRIVCDDGGELPMPVMCELQYLELFHCELTYKALEAILDSCPQLESLRIMGSFTFLHHRRRMDTKLRLKCAKVRNLTLPNHASR